MSAISELMRESPAYKKAALAVAVTAGVGACVYLGYRRCAVKGTDPRASKPGKKADSRQGEPSAERKEQLSAEKKTKEIEPVKITPPSPSKVETVQKTSSPQKSDELSTSGTFEKISLAPNESDNFEHLTMSQVQPTEASPPKRGAKDAKRDDDSSASSISFLHTESEGSASISNPPELFESLSSSQAEQSISFITSTPAHGQEISTSSVTDKDTESNDDDDLLAVASGIKLKDENDIVVVEQSSDDSGFEKEKTVRSGMAAMDVDFDSSRISPVFGRQTYQRVNVEPDEIEIFDPAKSHPASFGFKFDANI